MLLGRSARSLLHAWEASDRASQFPSKESSLGAQTLTYPYISHLRNVDDNLSQPFFYELSHDPWIP
jgi:hypothetical protein